MQLNRHEENKAPIPSPSSPNHEKVATLGLDELTVAGGNAPSAAPVPQSHGEEALVADIQRQNSKSTSRYQRGSSSPKFDISDLLEEVDRNGSSILLRRPDRISLSYRAGAQSSATRDRCTLLAGLKFRASTKGAIVIDGIQQLQNDTPEAPPEGTASQQVNACALMQGSQQSLTHFALGDVVEYASGADCRQGGDACDPSDKDCKDKCDNIKALLDNQDTDSVAMELNTIRHFCSNGLSATVCVSTTKSTEGPINICQATVLFPHKVGTVLYNKPTEEQGGDKGTQSSENDNDNNNNLDIGITFSQQDNRLAIKSISKERDAWFGSAGCAIKEGHIVVGINEFISSSFSPEDANSIIFDILSCPTTLQLSITTIATTQTTTKWDRIRKAAVAAGGGTLVASGAVLMATPLHPVGHAMALGGVGVLGMEFEAPRKVMSSAKERWSEKQQSWRERRRSSQLQREESASTCHDGK